VAQTLGLATGGVVLDTTGSPAWLEGARATPGALRFSVESGHRYLAVDERALLRPEVRRARADELRVPAVSWTGS